MRTLIMHMIGDIVASKSVSREEIAAHLGKTIVQFNNCLYQSNGQEFKVYELLELQKHYDVTHFTDYVCKNTGKSGGVYVSAPDVNRIDKTELYDLAIAVQKASADFGLAFSQALTDGVMTPDEYENLKRLQLKIYKTQIAHLQNAQSLYGGNKKHKVKKKSPV
jgi:hypothetical protein